MNAMGNYASPLGPMLLTADDEGLTGLWFTGQKYYAWSLSPDTVERDTAPIRDTRRWLDEYFAGLRPTFTPPLHLRGTDFRRRVWELLLEIPYGETTSYGAIATRLAAERGIPKMSSRAVGGAVGHNPVSLIVPCHRVIGANGSLTGYGGGMERKVALLELEGVDMTGLRVPTRGTAL